MTLTQFNQTYIGTNHITINIWLPLTPEDISDIKMRTPKQVGYALKSKRLEIIV